MSFGADLLDGKFVMGKFMRLPDVGPNVAGPLIVTHSSKWPIIEDDLEGVFGKSMLGQFQEGGG